jgi:hypothetical protein
VGGESNQPELSDCRELLIIFQQAERAHLHAWQQLAMYQETSGADVDRSRLSLGVLARLKQLAAESDATMHAWTDAFTTWRQACGDCGFD